MDIVSVLSQALENAKRAKNMKAGSQEYASALRWELYASLQNVLDGLAMIVADLGLRKPGTYSELGSVLQEHGILTVEEDRHVKFIARVRNTLAHAYRQLDVDDLESIKRDALPLAEMMSRKLIDYITRTGLDPEFVIGMKELRIKLEQIFRKHGVVLAYLYGSRSRGTAKKESDYDFAVLFEKYVGISAEIMLSLDIAEALNSPSDLVDVAALNKADAALKHRVLKEGQPIFWTDKKLKNRWERLTYVQNLELQDLHKLYFRKLKAGNNPILS